MFLFSVQSILAQVGNDLVSEDLKGKVKMVTEIQYCAGPNRPCMRTVDKYDSKGYLTEEIHNDYMLKIDTRKYLRYDTGIYGNNTRLNEFGDSGILIRAIDYKYNSLNHLTEVADHRSFGDKKVTYKTEYVYDVRGYKVQENNYTDNELDIRTDYSYDGKGRISGTKSYDRNDTVTMFTGFNYLAGSLQWINCEKQIAGTRTHIFRMIDTADVVLEKTTYTSDYSKQTTESYSSFDKQGNWLKDIVKGIENYMVIRKIEYYK